LITLLKRRINREPYSFEHIFGVMSIA